MTEPHGERHHGAPCVDRRADKSNCLLCAVSIHLPRPPRAVGVHLNTVHILHVHHLPFDWAPETANPTPQQPEQHKHPHKGAHQSATPDQIMNSPEINVNVAHHRQSPVQISSRAPTNASATPMYAWLRFTASHRQGRGAARRRNEPGPRRCRGSSARHVSSQQVPTSRLAVPRGATVRALLPRR